MSDVREIRATEKTEFGFWIYLMTDLILFASLFATYLILRHNAAGGPSAAEVLDTEMALVQTFLLLLSSFTIGISAIAFRFSRRFQGRLFLAFTVVLGACFLALEIREFSILLSEGASWRTSAFLSAFYTLVATHGVHIFIGLIWGAVLLHRLQTRGYEENLKRKLGLFTVYWHFLDLVWIMIFSLVYLGAVI